MLPSNIIRAYFHRIRFLGLYILLTISLILTNLDYRHNPLTGSLKSTITSIFSPIVGTLLNPLDYLVDLGNFTGDLTSTYRENKKLKEKLENLQSKLLTSEYIKNENKELKNLLQFVKTNFTSFKSSKVISLSHDPFIRSAIINLGKNDGIRKNQVIMTQRGLAGRIKQTGTRKSHLLLLTDINSRIPIITSKSRHKAIAAGNNSEILDVLYLPENHNIEDGETVVTSGDGDLMPFSLLVGTIRKNENGKIQIIPFVDFSKLEFVSVIEMMSDEL